MRDGRKRRVICLQTGLIYESMTDAAAAVPAAQLSGIQRVCKGERQTAGGMTWRYLDELLARSDKRKSLRQICDDELARIAISTMYRRA